MSYKKKTCYKEWKCAYFSLENIWMVSEYFLAYLGLLGNNSYCKEECWHAVDSVFFNHKTLSSRQLLKKGGIKQLKHSNKRGSRFFIQSLSWPDWKNHLEIWVQRVARVLGTKVILFIRGYDTFEFFPTSNQCLYGFDHPKSLAFSPLYFLGRWAGVFLSLEEKNFFF